jgi:hypothetical protein
VGHDGPPAADGRTLGAFVVAGQPDRDPHVLGEQLCPARTAGAATQATV